MFYFPGHCAKGKYDSGQLLLRNLNYKNLPSIWPNGLGSFSEREQDGFFTENGNLSEFGGIIERSCFVLNESDVCPTQKYASCNAE